MKHTVRQVATEDSDPSEGALGIVGYMPGTVQIIGDVVSPVDEEWDAFSQ